MGIFSRNHRPGIPFGHFLIYFKPQRDITAYELAKVLMRVQNCVEAGYRGVHISAKDWEAMGDEKRHWTLDQPWPWMWL